MLALGVAQKVACAHAARIGGLPRGGLTVDVVRVGHTQAERDLFLDRGHAAAHGGGFIGYAQQLGRQAFADLAVPKGRIRGSSFGVNMVAVAGRAHQEKGDEVGAVLLFQFTGDHA